MNKNNKILEWFSCQITVEDFTWLKQIDEPHKVIAFMELLATTIATDLWCRPHTTNESQVDFAFPSLSTDNLGNVYILQKFYTNKPPIVFLLHAFAKLCLKRKIRPIVSHLKGDSGELTDLADKLSRNLKPLDPETRVKVDIGGMDWLTSVRERPLVVEDCVFLNKSKNKKLKTTAKGGDGPSSQKRIPARHKAIRKAGRRMREMEIALEYEVGKESEKGLPNSPEC